MASRYWVGDTGNWSDTAHWSTASGGAGGASVPTATDDANFDSSSFSATGKTVTITANTSVKNVFDSGSTAWTLHFNTGIILTVKSNLDILQYQITVADTTSEIDMNGSFPDINAIDISGYRHPIIFRITNNTDCSLSDAFQTLYLRIKTLIIDSGSEFDVQHQTSPNSVTLDATNITVSATATFQFLSNTDDGKLKVYCQNWTANSTSTMNISGVGANSTTNIVLFIAGNGLDHTASTFTGGGLTYPATTFWATSVSVTGNNTFNLLDLRGGTDTFAAGSTTTTDNWLTSTTSITTLRSSTPGTQYTWATLTNQGVSLQYLDLKDNFGSITNGSTWTADSNSIDSGNNTNWTGGPFTPKGGGFLWNFINCR